VSGGFVVAISEDCWLAPWTGDPGRTCLIENAKRYKSEAAAKRALSTAAKRYKFRKLTGDIYRVEADASKELTTNPPLPKKGTTP